MTANERVELLRDLVTATVEATKAYNSGRGAKRKLARERKIAAAVLALLLDRIPIETEVDRVVLD